MSLVMSKAFVRPIQTVCAFDVAVRAVGL